MKRKIFFKVLVVMTICLSFATSIFADVKKEGLFDWYINLQIELDSKNLTPDWEYQESMFSFNSGDFEFRLRVTNNGAIKINNAMVTWKGFLSFGRIDNTFMYFNPPPAHRLFNDYSFCEIIPFFDDFGVALKLVNAKWLKLDVSGFKSETNQSLVTYVKANPFDWVELRGCWQWNERKDDGKITATQEAYWWQVRLMPIDDFEIRGMYISRKDEAPEESQIAPIYPKRNGFLAQGFYYGERHTITAEYYAGYSPPLKYQEKLTIGVVIGWGNYLTIYLNLSRDFFAEKNPTEVSLILRFHIGNE